MSNAFLYPNVTSLPGQSGVSAPAEQRQPKKQEGTKSDFDKEFEKALGTPAGKEAPGLTSLDQIKAPLKFSAHATQRLRERNIAIDPATMSRVTDAIEKADAKGVEDTLVLTSDAALIVNVKNRTVITAMDRGALNGNVFTNIDGAVIV